MCGIAGMVGAIPTEQTAAAMLASMRHRGPDGQGIFQQAQTTLLHTRLAIIDPEGGEQPMCYAQAGERYVLIYNGELYNTQELRNHLLEAGHQFQGHSDTEVVLHAYAEFGENCVELLNGIFAFAVWECNRQRLFLARDRIGVKPLFYWEQDGKLVFASEMKTIFASNLVPAELDETGAAQLLMLGPGRLPGSGVFYGLRELEPGCCAMFASGGLDVRRYWKLRDREHWETFDETSECVRYLVADAIKRQMVSDVPIATFLSGGLDSSIITAICAKEMADRGAQLQTFSVDYENNDRYFQANKFQPNSDGHYIQVMQEAFQTHHRQTVLSAEDLFGALKAATLARDLPGMADVDFSLLAFCGEIHRHVKVALSGECADEIFGGYPWYRDETIRAQAGFPWAQNTAQRGTLLTPIRGFQPEDFVMDAYSDTCRQSDILPGTKPQERRMKEMVNLNFRWFMQTLLDRKDRMSMHHSLEVRVPFCDYRIAEYLYSVPWEFKDYRGREKGLLRHAVADILPAEILHRKKSPYPKTFDPKYEHLVSEKLAQLLETDTPLWHLVRREEARKVLTEENPWPWYGQLMRRPQTIAYFLQLDLWLKHYNVKFRF